MKTLLLALLGILPWLPLEAATGDVVQDPFAPAKITSLSIEKDDGDTITTIMLEGDAITYKTTVGGKVTESLTAHPSADDWFNFIQKLNVAKVYKWLPRYYYPGQGPGWSINMVMEDRTFGSSGTNEYPKESAEDQPQADPQAGPSVPFLIFWQAAETLAGKQPPPATGK
jgi:hypothetical protein